MREVAAYARSFKGAAAILVQNAEELLSSDAFLDLLLRQATGEHPVLQMPANGTATSA